MLLTDDTRPRIASGVASCRMVERSTTEMPSKMPDSSRSDADSQNAVLRPKPIMQAPKPATETSRMRPALACSGCRDSHTATTTGYWVAENGAPTEAQPTVGQVTLSPKTVAAWCDYSRRLTLQSSIDVEAFVRADLAANLAQMIQIAAINGSGSSNQPTGVLNAAGIGSVAGGTNGLAPDWTHIVGLETLVSVANANLGSLGYLTNAKVRGKLLTTQKFASTNGEPVWGEAQTAGEGRLRGYAAYVTNAVPSDLTKGSSSGICSAIAFGNWQDLLVGFWGGLDILVDPYSLSTTGGKRITAFQDCDIAVRRAASFAAMKDALTT